jgi:hypothetical protein
MVTIRLRHPFKFHHAEIPEGTLIGVPPGIAQMLVQREVADLAEPERAVIEPSETRVATRAQRGRRKSAVR